MSTDYTNYRACDKCAVPLKYRTRAPYTYVYYQCPGCKTNYVGGSFERQEKTNEA